MYVLSFVEKRVMLMPVLLHPYKTYLTLPYLTLPYLTLPYLTLPYLTLPYLTLPYLTLSYLLQEVKVRPDAAVWNALIAAAGRAGQLQRAFEALQDMQVQPRLCCDSHILCHELCVFGLFLCILLASRTKHALSLI